MNAHAWAGCRELCGKQEKQVPWPGTTPSFQHFSGQAVLRAPEAEVETAGALGQHPWEVSHGPPEATSSAPSSAQRGREVTWCVCPSRRALCPLPPPPFSSHVPGMDVPRLFLQVSHFTGGWLCWRLSPISCRDELSLQCPLHCSWSVFSPMAGSSQYSPCLVFT